MSKLELLDTTLRDGAQAEGVSFSVEDKISIVRALDALGIPLIEAGNPASNPKEQNFFDRIAVLPLRHAQIAAFGATRRKGMAADADEGLAALLRTGVRTVVIFGKCWDLHVDRVLNVSLSENLDMISETVQWLCAQNRQVIFDAEHFFDGYKKTPDYALEALTRAHAAGAARLVLCDTNGGCFPHEITEAVEAVKAHLPDAVLGMHSHNDTGCAVANTIAAVRAGATHIQGTYLGFGERCGNADFSTLIPNLQLKLGYDCIPADHMPLLTSTARSIAETANLTVRRFAPYVGDFAFSHKAGMHAAGVLKCTESFEHIDPETVGNTRHFLVSEMAGKRAIAKKVEQLLPAVRCDEEMLTVLAARLKELEHRGYQFEGAEGSFLMLIRKELKLYTPSFELISYKVLDERPYDHGRSATATLKLRVGEMVKIAAADGDGPVNALDKALREALSEFYPVMQSVRLIDYKVRVIEPKEATAAVVRVLITSTDGQSVWSTIGVSHDIIEASFIALVDSVEYALREESPRP